MRELVSLIKLNFKMAFNPSTKKRNSAKIYFLVFFVIGIAISFFYAITFAQSILASKINNFKILVFFGFVISCFLNFILFISSAGNILYKSKDNNLMFSMPIKKHTIILAKMLSLLLIGYLYQFVLTLPFIVCYYIYSGFNIISLIAYIFSFILCPIVPFAVCCFIAFIIAYIAKKIKYKNLFSTIALFVVFAIFMYFYLQLDFSSIVTNNNTTNVAKYIPFLNWTLLSITNNNLIYVLYNLLLSTAFIFITYGFIYYTFFKMCSDEHNSFKSKKTKIVYKQQSVIGALFMKELRAYFASPMYVFNTFFAFLLLLGMSVYVAIDKTVLQVFYELSKNNFLLVSGITVVMCLIISTCSITGISISFERKKINVLKSLPISYKHILGSKILLAFIVGSPFIFVSSLIISIFCNLSVFGIIFVMLFPQFWYFSCCMFGIVINLSFPNLQTANDTVLVKQSLSAFLSVFIPLIYWLVVIIGFSFLAPYIPVTIYCIVAFCISLVFFIYPLIYLLKFADKKFKNLDC